MTLTTEEQAYTRSQGPYPTVRCDGCGVANSLLFDGAIFNLERAMTIPIVSSWSKGTTCMVNLPPRKARSPEGLIFLVRYALHYSNCAMNAF